MFAETLAPQTQQTLEVLKTAAPVKNFYLAGGTALALQLGHRVSEDLDFFSPGEFQPLQLLSRIKKDLPDFETQNVNQSWGTLKFFNNRTMVSFFTYDYPLLENFTDFEGTKIASIKDIGSMKITAIADRSVKKDFIDLYFICQSISFEDLLENFKLKYKNINFELYHYLKSLAYFEEAEDTPMPYMLKPAEWEKVKEFLRGEIKKYEII
ncbi:nucleotidyl transferase AbiEii/AbiGii toxin family protein [Patescibacteria group bacterium]|nr:nucleotidyl transferase AbiEii/AbiGii toxin family protein [Patescibacteria group bacterium]